MEIHHQLLDRAAHLGRQVDSSVKRLRRTENEANKAANRTDVGLVFAELAPFVAELNLLIQLGQLPRA